MVRVTPLAAVALVVGLVAGCSPNDGSGEGGGPAADRSPSTATSASSGSDEDGFQPTDEDRAAIRALLERRATALRDGDRAAFLVTVDTADDDLVRQQRVLFDNLQRLPVESIRYSVDDGAGYPTAKVRGDDPLFRPLVLEQVKLDIDTLPVTNILENTFVRRDQGWVLGAESKPGEHRTDREPQSRPWGGAEPIAVARSGRLLVVVDRRREESAQALARDMVGYIRFAAGALGVRPSYDVLVDATTVGAASSMNTVDTEEAAASTITVTHFGVDQEPRVAGTRIKVNPDDADRIVSSTYVMRHELTHYLTTRRLAPAPTWVSEGLAEWVTTAPASLDELVYDTQAVVHTLDVRRRLPTDGRWGLDAEADYLVARAAVTHLVDTYGVAQVLGLGRAYARIPGDDPDEKTDKVLRRVFGITEAALVRATWDALATLRRG